MNIKRLLVITICTMFLFALIMPDIAFAKGENDFTASLSVSDTSVPAGTTVTCTISVKNTDPTYGCDVSITTSGGSLVDSYYLAAGVTKTSTHNVTINSTQDIYYTVHASHGPDINKTKNTNTVTVVVEQDDPTPPLSNNDDDDNDDVDDYVPNDEIIADTPEPEAEPINGVPKSGSLFIAGFENIVYDGMPIEGDCQVMTDHSHTATMTGDIFYHLPDSIAATYLDRTEDEKCYLYVGWRMSTASEEAMDTIVEMYVLDTDDGVISFSQDIVLHDVPILYDDMLDNLVLIADLIDPVDGSRYTDYLSIGLVYGPEIDDEYTITLNDLYFNDDLITNTDEIIEVEYGTEFTLTQNFSYTINPDELSVNDLYRTRIGVVTYLDGDYPTFAYAPRTSTIPESASGDMIFEFIADRASYQPSCLDYGMHTLQITAREERDTLPTIDIDDTVVLTINVVPEGTLDIEDTTEYDAALELFDGTFFMDVNIWEWMGLGDSVEMNLNQAEVTLDSPGTLLLDGDIDYRANEEFYVRVSYNDYWLEHTPGDYIEEGTILFEGSEYIAASTTLEVLTELIALDDDEVLATDTDYVTVTVEPTAAASEYRQRVSIRPDTTTVAIGEEVTFRYSIINERCTESVHVQLIDNEDGSIIFEDTDFEPMEDYASSFTRTPPFSYIYNFTVQVLDDDGSIIWHWDYDFYIDVMPNHVPDGEDGVFDLNLGAESLEVAEGERARIYCSIIYAMDEMYLGAEDIRLIVEDQSGYVLHVESSVEPGSIIGFFEDYYLWDTTTFTITASGMDAHTGTAYIDTDEITITVVEAEDAIPESEYLDIDYEIYSGPRIISAGDSIMFMGRIENNSTETVTVAIVKDDGTFLEDAVEHLMPGEVMSAYEVMEFYDSTVVSFRAVAWATGSTVVFTETKYRAVLVDEELATGDDLAPEGEYAIDLDVVLSAEEIMEGDVVNVCIEAENTGTSPCTIIVSRDAGYVFEAGEETMPGDSVFYTMRWSPSETSTITVEARALDEGGDIQYITTATALLTVVDPSMVPAPLGDAAAGIDLVVTPAIAAAVSGGSIDYNISVENTGDVEFYQYVVSESLTGSHRICDHLFVGDTESFTVSQSFTRDTSIVFEVRGYAEDGTLLATDTQTVTVEILPTLPEDDAWDAPLPEDADPPSDMSAEPASEPMMDSAEPASSDSAPEDADAPADSSIESSSAVEEIYTGGVSMSLRSADVPIDNGRLIIVEANQEILEANERVYMMRRVVAALIALIAITLIGIIVALIARGKGRRPADTEQ